MQAVRVYLAGPWLEQPRVAAFAVTLLRVSRVARLDVSVVSTWHAEPTAGRPNVPPDEATGRAALVQNRRELAEATLAVALTRSGAGAETYSEIREAQLRGLPVIWSAERGGLSLSRWDPSVTVVALDIEAAAEVIDRARGA